MEHGQVVHISEWNPLLHYEAIRIIPWRYIRVRGKPVLYAPGVVIFQRNMPSWMAPRNSESEPDIQKKVDGYFKQYKKARSANTGFRLDATHIQYGNPDIAWIYSERRGFHIPIQASYLNLIWFMYSDAWFNFTRAGRPILIRSSQSSRKIIDSNIIGIIREYTVAKDNLPFRVPVGFKWF